MQIAKHVRIETGDKPRVLIDGMELPFYLADGPMKVEVDASGINTVYLPLLAESVASVDTTDREPAT